MNNAHILVVDDETEIRHLLRDILSDEGYEVVLAENAAQARIARTTDSFDLVLLDIWMPDCDGITLLREWVADERLSCPVVMMSGHGTIEAAVEATRLGAFDFIEKPLSLSKLLKVVQQALEAGKPRHRAAPSSRRMALINCRSRAIQTLREQVQRAAPSDVPVLFMGETGSGRETFAHYLHSRSTRAERPFVQLHPASIADDSAAQDLATVLQEAESGTVFIRGLDDVSPLLQRLLVSAIEHGNYSVPSDGTTHPLDVRFVAAAQPALLTQVAQGAFRNDLFNHLNIMTLQVPPLRAHTEDVPELLRHYAESLADDEHLPLRRFGLLAQNRLRNYPWTGNLLELRNLVRRLLMLGGADEIHLEELERELQAQTVDNEPLVKHDLLALPLREAREQFERAYLQQQLMLCDGKVSQLARRVGMERTHLYRKLRALGVDIRQLAED